MGLHRDGVYRVAYAIVGDHDQAEDVVQEAFMRAYESIHRFDLGRRFAPWIRRIAANCAISAARQHKRTERAGMHDVIQHLEPDASESVVANDLGLAIRQAITQLPRQQALAIALFALKEMDLAETAEVMGCGVGTVKRYLYRARQKLEEVLADHLEEDEKSEL